jgi:hypothetical protein
MFSLSGTGSCDCGEKRRYFCVIRKTVMKRQYLWEILCGQHFLSADTPEIFWAQEVATFAVPLADR